MLALPPAKKATTEETQFIEKIADLQRQLRALTESTPMRQTGRVDAQKVADYLGLPLKPFAEGLVLFYKAVHCNPSAQAIQEALQPVKRSLDILADFFSQRASVRAWLNTPHPDLDGCTALATILDNQAGAVRTILENALAGVPV